jgi:hypothetical protein
VIGLRFRTCVAESSLLSLNDAATPPGIGNTESNSGICVDELTDKVPSVRLTTHRLGPRQEAVRKVSPDFAT